MKDIDLKSHAIGMILKAVGVEPSLSGLIQAAGGKPEEVFQAVALTVEMAPKVITAVMEMDARMKRIEAIQVSTNDMLCDLCKHFGIDHAGYLPKPAHQIAQEYAQEVAEAAFAEASGRS